MSGTAPGTHRAVADATPRGVRWSGTRAFLLECGSLADVVAMRARLASDPLPGQVEVLAAAETLALSFSHRGAALSAAEVLRTWGPVEGDLQAGGLVEIEVVYDGEDLDEVGDLTGLGRDGLIRWHTGTDWIGAFGGFAPGFTYLVPADGPADQPAASRADHLVDHSADGRALDIPRRDSPRTTVPAGSVALAGRFSAVYPRSSPGGWQLIGRTNAILWDLDRPAPALVAPGDRVRYRAVREQARIGPAGNSDPGTTPAGTAATGTGPAVVIEHPGLQSLIQDQGRPGQGDLGVSAAGAADADSARQANRVVGNAAGAAVIETLLGGLRLRARGHQVLALTGAETPAVITAVAGGLPSDRAVAHRAPFALYDGETLEIGEPTAGLRTYVAVRGGLEADVVLGSRSTDSLSGLGPAPLVAGTEVPAGAGPRYAAVGNAEAPLRPMPRAEATTVLRVVPGPRDDWFGPAGLDRLAGQDWLVTDQCNRIGVRLAVSEGGTAQAGKPLERRRDGELASEGAVTGALQVPPSGLPVLFLADHPVTGGYPVIGVVLPEDLTLAAQLPPGAHVRFVLTTPPQTTPSATVSSETAPERIAP
ncbi:carboxyltransferase domain-containing protein [Citricoccus sp.]|uniref:5-oxoprolinase subunit B/C family protein n=1 Tax=Citricoccus sp. TaxID=1978372 RepID=UPI0028BEFE58|nr:carboxyltransferase domain-containing protein [Citricoccus sp.]